MKTFILSIILFFALLFTQAQSVYSLSGEEAKGIQFNSIENIETQETVLHKNDIMMNSHVNAVRNANIDAPNAKLMASLAFDSNSNTMVYMPMISSYVYFKNLDTQSLDRVDGLKEIHVASCNQGSHFTRMTTAPDGFVYALNNDFSELIQIDPKSQQIRNLGSFPMENRLDKRAKEFWGGDMVADSQNNLIIISAYGLVYKLNIKDKSVEEVGTLENRPDTFTTNGAAVLANGEILVSNSKGAGLYSFDINDLELKKYSESSKPSYDLASPFFIPVSEVIENPELSSLQLYPTIVNQKEINLKSEIDLRNAVVKVFDINSFEVASFKANRLTQGQESSFSLQNLQPNIYIVKVLDASGKELLNQKITVTK